MAHLHMHGSGYGTSYCEAEREVVRGPCDSYSSGYRVEEYANSGYPMGRHHHNNAGYVDKVTEVSYEATPGYRHHHNHLGGAAGYVERREETLYETPYDPCRRLC